MSESCKLCLIKQHKEKIIFVRKTVIIVSRKVLLVTGNKKKIFLKLQELPSKNMYQLCISKRINDFTLYAYIYSLML